MEETANHKQNILRPGEKAVEKAKRFQDLKVWQKSHQFVPEIYKLTRSFPDYELFGLTSQIRRFPERGG
jgi:hypothetical protein